MNALTAIVSDEWMEARLQLYSEKEHIRTAG